MSSATSIEWTDASWPIHAGCKETSPGCSNCYSARLTATRLSQTEKYRGLAIIGANGHPHFTGETRTHVPHLYWPLTWRSPRKIFVDDMSDLFYEEHSDEDIDQIFAVMIVASWHTYQILTKRAERMRDYLTTPGRHVAWNRAIGPIAKHWRPSFGGVSETWWPRGASNFWLGVSCESQQYADERIPLLLATPAAVRFVSAEPLLGPVDFRLNWMIGQFDHCPDETNDEATDECNGCEGFTLKGGDYCGAVRGPRLNWIIVGGESGPGARPFDSGWGRSIVAQCSKTGVPCFFKQVGARPYDGARADGQFTSFTQWVNKAKSWIGGSGAVCIDAKGRVCRNGKDMQRAHDEGAFPVSWHMPLELESRKGGDMAEWPEDLRVRQFPEERP